jgi:hypothetical protein
VDVVGEAQPVPDRGIELLERVVDVTGAGLQRTQRDQ